MLFRTDEEKERDKAELEGAKFHKFNDFVTVKGTGKFPDMPKGKVYRRVHKLAADVLVKKQYAEVTVDN